MCKVKRRNKHILCVSHTINSSLWKKKCCKSALLDAPVGDKTWWSVPCSDKMCKTMRENALGLEKSIGKIGDKVHSRVAFQSRKHDKVLSGMLFFGENMMKRCPSCGEDVMRCHTECPYYYFFASALQKDWVCHCSQIQQYDNDYLLLFWLKIAKTLSPSCHVFNILTFCILLTAECCREKFIATWTHFLRPCHPSLQTH